MKTIRIHQFGGPEVLKLETVPDSKPTPGQVLIRVKAAGVNPVDTYIRAGSYGNRIFPFTPGMDAAGVIEALGSDVDWAHVGDRVYVYGSSAGTYAELLTADRSQVHPLPSRVSFAQGAAMGVPYTTAYFAIFQRAQAIPGETILIHGASGGVGTAALQIARAHGLVVIGTGGTPKGQELAAKEGAHHVLDHHAPDFSEKIMKLTAGKGLNIIIEMKANVNLANDLTLLASRGRVVVVGNRDKIEINPREIMSRNADIRGMSLLYASPEEVSAIHSALGAGLENGVLRPVIGKEIPLAEAARAQEEILQPGAYGKIVLIP